MISLVTGGGGFIGSHLVERLVREGHEVRVVENFLTGRRENLEPFLRFVRLFEGDVRDGGLVKEAVAGAEVVFHEAAIPSVARSLADPVLCASVNFEGTAVVLEAARKAKVRRFVLAGSSSVYGDSPVLPKREDLEARPKSPYAASKWAAELYVKLTADLYGFQGVALRYFNVFGPRQDPRSEYAAVIPRFITAALSGGQPVIHGDGLQSRDFTYVENVVEANLRAAVAPGLSGQVLNVGCGRSFTLLDVLSALERILGRKIEPRFEPGRPGDVRASCADIRAAGQAIGYEPGVAFEEGLRRTVESFRRDGSPAP